VRKCLLGKKGNATDRLKRNLGKIVAVLETLRGYRLDRRRDGKGRQSSANGKRTGVEKRNPRTGFEPNRQDATGFAKTERTYSGKLLLDQNLPVGSEISNEPILLKIDQEISMNPKNRAFRVEFQNRRRQSLKSQTGEPPNSRWKRNRAKRRAALEEALLKARKSRTGFKLDETQKATISETGLRQRFHRRRNAD
jgi:hypothetical protein